MKYIVVTGASTGIGKDICRLLVEKDYFVFGSVRKKKDADNLRQLFGENFYPLIFDVTDSKAIQEAVDQVQGVVAGRGLFALINNAGVAVPGPLMHIPMEKFRMQFDINLFGLLEVTQAFLPLLGAELPQKTPPGKIINMSSVGGKSYIPLNGAYNASKHALECLSDVMRLELNIYGIQVVVVEPGAIKTPIWNKTGGDIYDEYLNTDYKEPISKLQKLVKGMLKGALEPAVVSRTILKILHAKKPKVRYALPDRPISGWLLPRLLPNSLVDKVMIDKIGLKKRDT